MKTNKISVMLGVLLAFFLSLSLVSALEVEVSPSSFSQSILQGGSGQGVFNIENVHNETLAIGIVGGELSRTGGGVIQLTFNSSLVNIPAGETRSVSFSYAATSNQQVGSYTGNIVVRDSTNTSDSINVPVTVQVSSSSEIFEITNWADQVIRVDGENGDRIDEIIRLRNIGSIALNNVRITTGDFEGDSTGDYIEAREVTFSPSVLDLASGRTERIDVRIRIPNGIDPDVYRGVIRIESDEAPTEEFDMIIEVTGGALDVEIENNREDVIAGVFRVFGEPGELVSEKRISVRNPGRVNANNIRLELRGDLVEQFTGAVIPASAVTFSPSSFDLRDGERRSIRASVTIPANAATGNYYADLRVVTSSGLELSRMPMRIQVVGDVYISSINVPDSVNPDETLEVEVTVRNQGSLLQRNVRVQGTLINIDSTGTDLTHSSQSFLLNARDDRTETLRFRIPRDALDGPKTLEIRVLYGGDELIEVVEVEVSRSSINMVIDSFVLNPATIRCDDRVFALARIQNLGRFDENVRLTLEVEGQNLRSDSGLFELRVNQVSSRNLALDVSSLQAGTYNVVLRAVYRDGLFVREQRTLTILPCLDNGGIDVEPIVEPSEPVVRDDIISIFGFEMERLTAYLVGGVGAVLLLVLVLLFFV